MAARKATTKKRATTRKPAKKAANRTIIKAKRVVIRATKAGKGRTKSKSHTETFMYGIARKLYRDGKSTAQVMAYMRQRGFSDSEAKRIAREGRSVARIAHRLEKESKATNPKRRAKNAESFSPDHPIEVRRYYRGGGPGYETKRQRVIRQGQRDLFAPEASTDELLKYLRAGNPTVISVVKKRLGAKAFASASPSLLRKTMTAILKEKKAKAAKAKAKPRKRNPETKAQAGFESFNGRPSTKEQKLNFPDGTPSGLYVLGQFVAFQLVGGATVKPSTATGKTYLCADTRGKLHLGTTGERLTDAPRGEVGTIKLVEYLQRKPHLGFPEKTIFFHKAGEETGEKPTLYSDGKGGLLIRGGAYSITPEGIRN